MAESNRNKLERDLSVAPASTEQRIRQAALGLFARKGFEGTGIRDIATEVGITMSTLYHYMGDKQDLLRTILRESLLSLDRAAREVVRRHTDPRVQLAGLVRLHVWVHGVRILSARVGDTEVRSLTGSAREDILQLRDSYQQIWRDVLNRGAASGLFEPQNPKIASIALLEMCNGVSRWYSPDGQLQLEEVCALFADWALAMVRVQGDYATMLAEELDTPDSYYIFDPEAARESPEASA